MIGNEIVKAEDIQVTPGYPLFFDTETIGLYGRICIAQFYQENWDTVKIVQFDTAEDIINILPLLNETKVVMFNASYDISTIQRNLNYRFIPKDFEDAFYLARLYLYEQKEHNLEAVTNSLIGPVYTIDGGTKKAFQKSNWSGILTEQQREYAAKDVYYLAQIYDKVKEMLDDKNYQLDMFSLKEALHYQMTGLPVDLQKCQDLIDINMAEIDKLGIKINFNSYRQVEQVMGAALCNPKFKGTDKLSMKKYALKPEQMVLSMKYDASTGCWNDLSAEEDAQRKGKIEAAKDVATKVIKAKSLDRQNAFLQKFINLSRDGRIYSIMSPSAKSGRFTSKEQNLQQLPRSLRTVFALPEDSANCIIAADFAQLELRCVAVVAKEERMIKVFREQGDPHGLFAKDLFGDYTDEQRRAAKTCNFTLLYGAGAETLADTLLIQSDIVVTNEEAQKYLHGWRETWPSIRAWQMEGSRLYNQGSHKQTPMGRRYVGDTYMAHLNIEIQGFGAEVCKLALHLMLEEFKQEGLSAECINFIHDEFVFEVNKNEVEEVGEIIISCMKQAWSKVSKLTDIDNLPMPVEVAAGYNWGELKNGKTIWQKSVD